MLKPHSFRIALPGAALRVVNRQRGNNGYRLGLRLEEFPHDKVRLVSRARPARCAAVADDWPQWQGPDRNAVSKEKGLLQEWPKDGPPLAWKAKGLGGGDSAPSVAGGKLFGMSNRGDDEVVWCLSETDGKELWVTRLGPAFQQRMPQSKEGPGCTPTVDGERLYVLGMGGDLACLQVKDGKVLWQLSLTKEFGGQLPMWSYRESPLVDGDKVICTPGGPDATIVALDKATGKTIWKSKVPAGAAARRRARRRPAGSALRRRPTPRRSPSISPGSASTCNSPRRHARRGRGVRRQGPLAVRPSRPTAWESTAPRRSTTTARCSPPRPTARAAGW